MKPVNEPFANFDDISKAKELLNWEPLKDLIVGLTNIN